MSKTLDEIRKKLQAMEANRGGRQAGSGDKLTYPHWDLKANTSSTIRFLPDGNDDNVLFWVENQKINLPFAGIKDHDEHKPVVISVPCIEMWTGKNTCPILNEVRPMWNDDSLKEIASKYWIKRSYFMQGVVLQDGIGEESPPENPIRRFNFTNQLFNIVKTALLDPEMENSPVDLLNGTDFTINRTQKGNYADYTTSKWARRESPLAQQYLDAIDQYGLPDLSSYLPQRPSNEHVEVMFDMFRASIDGGLYEPAKWAEFYRPYGFEAARGSSNTVSVPRSAPVKTPVENQGSRARTRWRCYDGP